MYRYSPTSSTNLIKAASSLLMENSNIHSRETAFDPLNYEFDAETMVEPFTYFHNGPTESRRKIHEFSSSSSLTHFSWLPTANSSVMSSPDESPQSHFSPALNEQINGIIQLKTQQNISQQQQKQPSVYTKTICRHCKSHNMPECLYTSHTMYDETGAIFCPVLKKCHCATCIRVTNPNIIRDDDSDDDNNIRLPMIANEYSHLNGTYPRQNSYRMINTNSF
ncbi:unnamed protein product [Rotaria sp. Silwood1]|nr:unnamed protein product [Rotaria sp. Silwood1]CAF3645891.1 unnamed protein product [Rotaria sp. Silwood1]CAF4839186.1 unnamed protein product [Rotaria sp. Silwood1]CAF4877041.1 unnamed protein product [Rotaria sp. Silwood1]